MITNWKKPVVNFPTGKKKRAFAKAIAKAGQEIEESMARMRVRRFEKAVSGKPIWGLVQYIGRIRKVEIPEDTCRDIVMWLGQFFRKTGYYKPKK